MKHKVEPPSDPGFSGVRIGLVHASWHEEVVAAMVQGAREALLAARVPAENILQKSVSGCFELPFGAQAMVRDFQVHGVVCVGCLVRGETPHFEYLARSVTDSLAQLSCQLGTPIGFGVLTVDNKEQAKERSGGRFGNKGEEAACALIHALKSFPPR